MAAGTSALEFFVMEASGYIDGLDSLLGTSGTHGPERDAFVRLARALRGNSVMYRQPGITRVATALEQCARALRDQRLAWDARLHAALVATVDDLRTLVRNVRQWSAADDQRADRRATELEGFVPAPEPAELAKAATDLGGRAYLASKTREVASALSRLAESPHDASANAALLREVRLLNGVAVLREFPALSEVAAAVETDARHIEQGGTPAALDDPTRMRAVADALRHAAERIEAGESAGEPALRELARELEGANGATSTERIVSISELFYSDEGETIVTESPAPPTSAGERFRIEVVGIAEHARRVIADVRRAPDDSERDKGWRALERAFRSLVDTAESFGERAVASALGAWDRALGDRKAEELTTLDEAAAALADPAIPGSSLQQRLEQLATAEPLPGTAPSDEQQVSAAPADEAAAQSESPARPPQVEAAAPEHVELEPSIQAEPPAAVQPERVEPTVAAVPDIAAEQAPVEAAAAVATQEKVAPDEPAPGPLPPPRRPARNTPTGDQLRDLLQSGITELGQLDERPLTAPVPLPMERVVPIETLVYRGRAAVKRATELRDEIRSSGAPPSPDALEELYALLDLALAE
jgi:chemotaxis protein histidine kinase CheA